MQDHARSRGDVGYVSPYVGSGKGICYADRVKDLAGKVFVQVGTVDGVPSSAVPGSGRRAGLA
jgi:hypothetical protein